ncbi:MAG: guanylate kinase [Gammaproteobacteria bacterium]
MSILGNLFIISAPSGAGKTTLVNAVVQDLQDLQVSVSYTTRPKRPLEQDGLNYHFVSREKFQEMIQKSDFLEFAEVFNNYYGTSKTWVDAQLKQGLDVILEIDWQGAEQLRRLMSCVSIFIIPPNIDTLLSRLQHRNQDSPKVIEERVQGAKIEIGHYAEYDYLICNDHFERAYDDLKAIIIAERLKIEKQGLRQQAILRELLS